MHPDLFAATRAWDQANTDSASIETGIGLLADVANQASRFYPQTARLIAVCGRLLVLYAEQGTDPDGDASQRVYEEAGVLGYEPL